VVLLIVGMSYSSRTPCRREGVHRGHPNIALKRKAKMSLKAQNNLAAKGRKHRQRLVCRTATAISAQINRENVHKRTDTRLDKVQDSVRKLTRLVPPRSSQPIGTGSAGADELSLSFFVCSDSPSIAKVRARGRGWYRRVLQSPGSA
jgi:hypothetical protein